MTETSDTRSRRAALGGLVVQIVAFAALFALGKATNSWATYHLSWFVLGGVPIWFVSLLVFRQRELAALEALDLEELRREKRAGGGEALFGEEEAGGLGFRVAAARLRWMQRWLVPGFGLATALYLTAAGIWLWRSLTTPQTVEGITLPGRSVGGAGWAELTRVPIAMVVQAILMLGMFLLSRYTSGMGRVPGWQLLRACGSYLLGNTLLTMALLVCLGVQQYAGTPVWEQTLAYVIPVVMLVLAIEMLINFVLDIYRPRAPGVEPRACFDSRLLGLLAEPGGIARSIAEAINYQFGFQVSQTWFYKLLERTFGWLVLAGAISLWLLSTIVIVQPYEHVIIERWGRQLNAARPLPPGVHLKWPWPIEVARSYNTGQLHQLHIGFQNPLAVPDYGQAMKQVMLWTDERHMGLEHFDFMICPPRRADQPAAAAGASQPAAGEVVEVRDSPVNLMRMDVVVQYRLCPDRLDRFSGTHIDPSSAVRNVSWEETTRFAASVTADDLLGHDLGQIGNILRERIGRRVEPLGLEIVYVGVTNVHPEKTVAEAYRNVVKAEQEKVAAIREALVTENERLSKVAGEAGVARRLALAVERNRKASELLNDAEALLSAADPAVVAELSARLEQYQELFAAHVDALARLERVRDDQRQIELDFELGLGRTLVERARAHQAVSAAEAAEKAAAESLERALAPLREEAAARLGATLSAVLIQAAEARVARGYWEQRLAQGFSPLRLEGEAAALLAQALAERWTKEMEAAKQVIQMQNEREAYRAAPEIYRARRLIDVLVQGMKEGRKFFLAFDPRGRLVRVRFNVEDTLRLEPVDLRTPRP